MVTTGLRIRLIALDLDGTLLDGRGGVPERNREALRAAAARGVAVALASGRMTPSITPTAEALGLDCPIIAYNGGMARLSRAGGRRIIFHRPLDARHGRALIDYCRGRYLLNFYVDDVLYGEANPRLAGMMDLYSKQTGAHYEPVPDLGFLADREPTKALIVTTPAERERLYGEWTERWGGEVNIVKTNPEYLEFLHRDANKGVALVELARALGLARGETMAMGDGDNDAPMLAAAGLGIAVANASALAKKSAAEVSPLMNDECAVAEAVERYVLGRSDA
jgi:Cof subfamily protein (haloacid dehalogenase superfamily)